MHPLTGDVLQNSYNAPGCVLWISFVTRNEGSILGERNGCRSNNTCVIELHTAVFCLLSQYVWIWFSCKRWRRAKRTIVIAYYERKIYCTVRIKFVQTSKTVNQSKLAHSIRHQKPKHEFGMASGALAACSEAILHEELLQQGPLAQIWRRYSVTHGLTPMHICGNSVTLTQTFPEWEIVSRRRFLALTYLWWHVSCPIKYNCQFDEQTSDFK